VTFRPFTKSFESDLPVDPNKCGVRSTRPCSRDVSAAAVAAIKCAFATDADSCVAITISASACAWNATADTKCELANAAGPYTRPVSILLDHQGLTLVHFSAQPEPFLSPTD